MAVVGAGGWGRQHTRIFSQRTDTELCAIVGTDPDRTANLARDLAVPGYVDLDTMMAEQRPDLISVSLPNEQHFDTTLALVRTGIPLIVEKPLVFRLEEADALLAEAERSGTFFAINFNHRYAEPVKRLKAAVEGGTIGDPIFATWRFGGEANPGDTPYKGLIETQCHGFDMLEHILGPIKSVSAEMTARTSTVALALSFASGAVGTLLGSYDTSYAYPETHRLEVNGSLGRVVVSDTVKSYALTMAGSDTSQVWTAGYFNDEARSFHQTFDRHVDDILRALRAGEPPPVHASAGRRALLLAHCAIDAFEAGRRVEVPVDEQVRNGR